MTSERSDFAPLKQLLDELMMSPTRQGPPMEVDASAVRFMLKRKSMKFLKIRRFKQIKWKIRMRTEARFYHRVNGFRGIAPTNQNVDIGDCM